MPSLSQLKQKDWIKAAKKLGLEVKTKSGKGSHCLIVHPETAEKYTIQIKLHKLLNQKYYNKLKSWGFTEEQINDALK